MLLHLSALIALLRGLSLSPPRCPCPVFCLYLSVEACLSPSLPFAVFALRLVGCDNVCCSSLVLSITAGSMRFPAVNSQSIYVPFGLVNSKKKKGRTTRWLISQEVLDAQWLASCAHLYGQVPGDHAAAAVELKPPQEPLVGKRSWVFPTYLLGVQEFLERMFGGCIIHKPWNTPWTTVSMDFIVALPQTKHGYNAKKKTWLQCYPDICGQVHKNGSLRTYHK